MKGFFLALGLLSGIISFGQNWTDEQIDSADVAKDIEYLSESEKDAIMYINLARLYPKQFLQLELQDYYGTERYGEYLKESKFRKSLITKLKTMKPVQVLLFDSVLYDNAKCFAREMGESGYVGHKRKTCKRGNYAECCSYGMDDGKDIAMQWLIDDKVASLGHRINCLNPSYSIIGLSAYTHKLHGFCAVAELSGAGF